MAHAEKCPVCGGTGKIPCAEKCGSTASQDLVTCHGCGGTGWVTVTDATDWQIPNMVMQNVEAGLYVVRITGDTKPIREPEE